MLSEQGGTKSSPWETAKVQKQEGAPKGALLKCFKSLRQLEREMGFEPTTPTLARLCSTPELHPRSRPTLALLPNPSGSRLKALSGVVVDPPSDVHRTSFRASPRAE